MPPMEKNGRTLIRIMAQHFPAGVTCEDLRRQFEKDTSLARQSFYNALLYVKARGLDCRRGKRSTRSISTVQSQSQCFLERTYCIHWRGFGEGPTRVFGAFANA